MFVCVGYLPWNKCSSGICCHGPSGFFLWPQQHKFIARYIWSLMAAWVTSTSCCIDHKKCHLWMDVRLSILLCWDTDTVEGFELLWLVLISAGAHFSLTFIRWKLWCIGKTGPSNAGCQVWWPEGLVSPCLADRIWDNNDIIFTL